MNIFTTALGFITAGILLSICLLHVYWALGGKSGAASAIPDRDGKPLFAPSAATTLLVALGLFIGCLIIMGALGFGPFGLPPWLFKIGIWGLATIFLLRAIGDFRWVGFFKSVRNTTFARNDTRFYSPLCAGLAIACTIVGAFA